MANTFKIKVAGETQEFEQSLGNLNSGLKMLKSEARSLNKSLKIDPQNTETASKLYGNLTQQLELTQKKAEEVKKNLATINPNVDLKGFVSAQNQLRNLQTESKKLESTLSTVSSQPHELNLHLPHLDGQHVTKPLLSSIQSSAPAIGDALGGAIKSGLSSAGSIAASAGRSIVKGLTAPLTRIREIFNEVVIGGLRQIGASAISKLGDAFSDIKSSMQETQTATNGLKKVMQFRGISSQFDYLRKSLAQTAINTNIDTKTAEKFGSVLIGVGKNASETAKIVNAAANANQAFGGSGEAFESVSLALGQIEAAGKVTADNINQITDANSALGAALKSQVFENYKNAGGSAKSFNDAMSKGEITTDDLTKALIELSSKGGKAVQTLPDSIASLEETVGTKLQPVFDGLTKAMIPIANKAADLVQSMDFTSVAKKISSINFEQIFAGIGDAITPVIPVAAQLGSAFSQAFSTLSPGKLQAGFESIVTGAQTMFQILAGIVANAVSQIDLSPFVDAFANVGNTFNMLSQSISKSGLGKALSSIFAGAINSAGRLLSSTTGMAKGILRAMQPLLKGLRPVMKGISSLFHAVFGTISKVFNAITKDITKLVSAFLKEATPGLKQAFKSLGPVLKAIGRLFSHLGNLIIWLSNHIITPILVPAFKILGKIIGWLAKIIAGPIDVIKKCIDGLVWAFDKLKDGLKAIEKPIKDFMNSTGKTLGEIGDKIGKFFGVKNGLGLDAKIRNYKSDVSNSMMINNSDATINVTPTMGQNPEAIAREVARLIRAGAV